MDLLRNILLRLTLATLVMGCDGGTLGSSQPQPQPKPQASAAPSQSAPKKAPPAEVPPPTLERSLSESAVRGFIERWAQAQSDNDFKSYSSMYADRFTGTKRVGRRKREFNRASWMRDRQPMFGPGLKVIAKDFYMQLAPPLARVHFTQIFEKGNFRDEGPKELVLLESKGELKITREEMLASRVAGQKPSSTEWSKIMPVVEQGTKLIVDQRTKPLDEEAFAGPPKKVNKMGEVYVAERRLKLEGLSSELANLRGTAVTTFQADGTSCIARVEDLRARVHVIPHFGQEQQWLGMRPPPNTDPPLAEAAVAKAIWELGLGVYFVMDLEPACPGAIWATFGAKPSAVAVPEFQPGICESVMKHVRQQQDFTELAEAFAKNPDGKRPHWYEADTCGGYQLPDGQAYVLLHLEGGAGCGEFRGVLAALYQVTELSKRGKIVRSWAADDEVRSWDTAFILDGRVHFVDAENEVSFFNNDFLDGRPLITIANWAGC